MSLNNEEKIASLEERVCDLERQLDDMVSTASEHVSQTTRLSKNLVDQGKQIGDILTLLNNYAEIIKKERNKISNVHIVAEVALQILADKGLFSKEELHDKVGIILDTIKEKRKKSED